MKARAVILPLMSALLAAASAIATEPQNDALSSSPGKSQQRSLSAIQADIHTALRAEALTHRLGQNTQEVMRLIELYREMAVHPKRDTSRLLRQLGLQLRSRLEKVRDQIERQHSQRDRRARKEVLPAVVVPETHVLTQQIAVQRGTAIGPSAQPAARQPSAAMTIDYGPDLVELIQQTISPATWDINGGNGSIVYFVPRQVIVVSAPGTVHDQIGGVVGQLRSAP